MIADRLFSWIRSKPFFLRMTLFTRMLLAAGFIPTGWVKFTGHRFTVLTTETPVGAFFEAMYQTGGYWRFLGATQVIAGCLLLVPRFAHLGAALFVPIMVNIFVITVAMHFRGTPFITGQMLLAVLYLCAWDYHRFRSIFTLRPLAPEHHPRTLVLDRLEKIGFGVFGAALMAFFLLSRGLGPTSIAIPSIALGAVAGLFTLGRFLTTGRRLTATEPSELPDR
jgi:uncharacterized membrane protein YphA (DoxX/SURF4 family)